MHYKTRANVYMVLGGVWLVAVFGVRCKTVCTSSS